MDYVFGGPLQARASESWRRRVRRPGKLVCGPDPGRGPIAHSSLSWLSLIGHGRPGWLPRRSVSALFSSGMYTSTSYVAPSGDLDADLELELKPHLQTLGFVASATRRTRRLFRLHLVTDILDFFSQPSGIHPYPPNPACIWKRVYTCTAAVWLV
jgi:hypothetical protein